MANSFDVLCEHPDCGDAAVMVVSCPLGDVAVCDAHSESVTVDGRREFAAWFRDAALSSR
jgi:hypothetical protein